MSQIIHNIRKDTRFMEKLSKLSYTARLRKICKRVLTECNRKRYKFKATQSEVRAICVIIERNL